ncbi:MAG: 3-oxoacyl-[acyl-carrier-protein] reductase [Candidatus Omnitrophica bacterium]|nr:3-oxoacyl-[acyl-carrier-protein] reductase [Candidatus Omnitrophota bacterium]
MKKFKDKVIVVTGGSRGIGKACCEAFAREGANIVFTYNSSQEAAKSLKQEIETSGSQVLALQLDVKKYDACRKFVEKVLDKFQKIDVLINNAGIINDKALMMMSESDWLDVINTNLNGTFNVTKNSIISFMKQRKGNIINISSLSGILGLPRQANYAASKGGMISFTRSLAREVAPLNIRVNAIAPGFIQTDMIKGLREDYVKDVLPQIPLGRFGEAKEVAQVALFLAGDESDYITGQVLRVDGGLGM